MKTTKKLFSLLLALVLTVALCAPAFAQTVDSNQGGSATITIENAARGETYSVYKLFDAKVTGADGGSIAYSGEIPTSLASYFAYVNGTNSENGIKEVENADADARAAALADWAKTATAIASAQATEGNALTFTGLAYGYYVITTSVAGEDGALEAKANVSVTSTNPNATIYDKNVTTPGGEGLTKTHTEGKYKVGDVVPYTVAFPTANYAGGGADAKMIVSYTISDNFANGLLEIDEVTSIKIGDVEYKVDGAVPQFVNGSITIPWADVTTNNDGAITSATSKYNNGVAIEIKYNAVITGEAATATDGITNKVTLSWTTTEGPGTPEEKEDPAPIKTYGFNLKKEDSSYNFLDGAEFALYTEQTGGTAMSLVKVTETDEEGNTSTYYRPVSDADNTTDSEAEDYVTTTTTIEATDGVAMVKGLAKNTTYYLEETKAPAGYNKLTTRQEVNIVEGDLISSGRVDKDGNAVMEKDEEGNDTATQVVDPYGIVVMNLTGAELPSTGGMGTTILTVVGLSIMVVAAVLLITKKRMEGKEEE